MAKWSSIVKDASEAEDFGDRWSPPQDWEGTVQVIKANGKEVNNLPRFGIHLEIRGDDEFAGKKFWTNLMLTSHAGVNKRVLKHLASFGISESFLDTDPTTAVVASALEGNVARMKAGYRKDKEDPTKLWDNHTFEGIEGASADTVVVEPDDDDDDWDED